MTGVKGAAPEKAPLSPGQTELQTPRLRNRGDSWTEREDDGRTDVEDTWEGASPDQHPRTIKRIALETRCEAMQTVVGATIRGRSEHQKSGTTRVTPLKRSISCLLALPSRSDLTAWPYENLAFWTTRTTRVLLLALLSSSDLTAWHCSGSENLVFWTARTTRALLLALSGGANLAVFCPARRPHLLAPLPDTQGQEAARR